MAELLQPAIVPDFGARDALVEINALREPVHRSRNGPLIAEQNLEAGGGSKGCQ